MFVDGYGDSIEKLVYVSDFIATRDAISACAPTELIGLVYKFVVDLNHQ